MTACFRGEKTTGAHALSPVPGPHIATDILLQGTGWPQQSEVHNLKDAVPDFLMLSPAKMRHLEGSTKVVWTLSSNFVKSGSRTPNSSGSVDWQSSKLFTKKSASLNTSINSLPGPLDFPAIPQQFPAIPFVYSTLPICALLPLLKAC